MPLFTMLLLATGLALASEAINEDKFYRGGQIGIKFVGNSPKFKLYSFAPLTDTAPPTTAGTATAPPTVTPDPNSGFTFVEVDTFKEAAAADMTNPLNEVNSFSSTDHAISVTEVGDNAKVDFITTFAGPTGNRECAGREPTSGTFSMVTDIVQTTTTETNPDNSTYTVRGGTAKFNLFTENYVSCSLSQTIPQDGYIQFGMSLKAGGQERVEIGESAAGVKTLTYGVEGGRMTVEFPAAAMIGYGSSATAAITGTIATNMQGSSGEVTMTFLVDAAAAAGATTVNLYYDPTVTFATESPSNAANAGPQVLAIAAAVVAALALF